MRHVKTIESPGSARFLLDLHTDYLQRIIEVVRGIAPAKIFLEADDINRWDAGIKEQSEITREVRASKTTEDLGKKDEERDRIITSLFQDIRSATLSPIAARSEPGRTLKLIVDVYKGLQRERWAGKTVHTKGLLDDLAKPEAAAAVAALHLTETVALLRTTNDAFSTLRESRTTKSIKVVLPQSKKIQNDKMTSYIFQYIEAAYIATTSDEDRKAIGQLIDQINARIRESKATHNKSQAQKKAAAEKKKKKPDAPKEPKEPKPKKPKKGNDQPDIKLPEEEPKKPDAGGEGKKPEEGGGAGTGGGGKAGESGGPEITLPEA